MLDRDTQERVEILKQTQNHIASQAHQNMQNASGNANFLQDFRNSFRTYCQVTEEKAILENQMARYFVAKEWHVKSIEEIDSDKHKQIVLLSIATVLIDLLFIGLGIFMAVKFQNNWLSLIPTIPCGIIFYAGCTMLDHMKTDTAKEVKVLYYRHFGHKVFVQYMDQNTSCGDYTMAEHIK